MLENVFLGVMNFDNFYQHVSYLKASVLWFSLDCGKRDSFFFR